MTRNYATIRFLRSRIPAFVCKPGCHDCCGPVTASSEEMANLPVKSIAQHEAAHAELNCPYLGKNGCEAYDERPLICRLFGTTPRLPCPNGNRPQIMIAPEIEGQINHFLLNTRQVLI